MIKKIIINADDCGKSSHVNSEIEHSIIAGKITSTTIMANMDDFEGAVRLYNKYHDRVSFGWHINLDEGSPLTNSQLLLDKGFYVEKEGKIVLNGMTFGRKYLSSAMRKEIKKELKEQWTKIRDHGVSISHADSHHYIHTQPSMIQVLPTLFKELKIERCRHVANYGVKGISVFFRDLWAAYYRKKGLRMTDSFCSFKDYYNNPTLNQGNTIELMIHPGHKDKKYDEEYQLMFQADYYQLWPNVRLITYLDI